MYLILKKHITAPLYNNVTVCPNSFGDTTSHFSLIHEMYV